MKFISCYKCKTRSRAGGWPIGKFRHFLPFVGKTIKLIDSIFFIVRDQFSAMIKKNQIRKSARREEHPKSPSPAKDFNH